MKKFGLLLIAFLGATITVIAGGNENTPRKINIVFIGNSITSGWYLGHNNPPELTVRLLERWGYRVKHVNCGRDGSTTFDWLPSSNDLFLNAVNAAESLNKDDAQLIFSIMLGTNDSAIEGPRGAPVAPEQYKKNLTTIINELVRRYPKCKIILNRPLWYSPNTQNSSRYLQEGLDRLQTYFPEIESLIQENPNRVYRGDTDAFAFFKINYLDYLKPEDGHQGIFYLHPNEAGANKLAAYWANAMKRNFVEWGYDLESGKIKVACIGNSITENVSLDGTDRYPAVLQSYLGDNYIVRNMGIGMRTMLRKGDYPYSKEEMYQQALDWNPDIVIIELGTNDAKDYNWGHKAEYEQDYVNFVNSFKALPSSPKIYLCYPLPVFPNNWLLIDNKTFTDEVIPKINNVAATTGTSVIDLYTPFLGKRFMTYDDVHPNYKGTTYMAHIISSVICPDCIIPEFAEKNKYLMASDDLTKHTKSAISSITANLKYIYDNNLSTDLNVPFVDNSWITFEFSTRYSLTGYSIISGQKNLKDAPSSWIIEGSTTGTLWSKIDEKNNISFDTDQSPFFSTISNPNNTHSYKYYRIKFKGNNGGNNLQLDEIQLYGFESTTSPSLINNGGVLSQQYEGYPGELVDNLNDLNIKSKYCVVDKSGGWIQYTSPQKAKVEEYTITSSFGINSRNPRSWTFEASNDGINWDLIDSKRDQDFVAYFHTMRYPVECEKEYTMFRLNIENMLTSSTFEFAEWQLFGKSESALNENKKDNIFIFTEKGCINIRSNSERILYYDIVDLSGRILISQSVNTIDLTTPNILAKGTYLVRIKTDRNTFVKKCIVFL